MNETEDSPALHALEQARQAVRAGDRQAARRWASEAARLDPNQEDPWLILAGLASPKASLEYLQRALQVNPHSDRAQKGVEWALQRLQEAEARQAQAESTVEQTQPVAFKLTVQPETITAETENTRQAAVFQKKSGVWAFPLSVFALLILVFIAYLFVGDFRSLTVQAGAAAATRPVGIIFKPSLTPTITPTFTPTATFTPTPTATLTPTPTPTDTPTPTPTETLVPTDTATPQPTNTAWIPPVDVPAGVGSNERWIDVDLSQQQVYAYQGDELVASFIVSTGTWLHPTVTGTFRIYLKLLYDDMAGPGYYLPDVPYTMYFYKGYALHGTYWHSNFGTPMSHGCVNLQTSDAQWLFNWASEGTIVHVHE